MDAVFSDFVDIHTHILPGLDDGPKSIDGSIAIAQCYQNAGVKRIIATPHFIPGTAWAADCATVLDSVRNLQVVIENYEIDLEILPGMEIAFHSRLVERICSGQMLPLGNSEHFLIEPPLSGIDETLIERLIILLNKDIKIIIAHPERVEIFKKKRAFLDQLISCGAKVQVNSGSLLGYFGRTAQNMAMELFKNDQLHFFASDTHDHTGRKPLDRSEWEHIANLPEGKRLQKQCVERLNKIIG